LNSITTAARLEEIRKSAVMMPQIGISSTLIRNRVAAGESIRFQVPRGVESYIETHKLYRT